MEDVEHERHIERFDIAKEWLKYLFTEGDLHDGLGELAAWGRWLDPLDKEQVRLLALPPVRRALGPDAPLGSAERLVEAALGLGADVQAEALALAAVG